MALNAGDRKPIICYSPKPKGCYFDRDLVQQLENEVKEDNLSSSILVPEKSAKVWHLLKGQICRITVAEGSQVGDMNFWNLHDHAERFFAAKTSQIQRTHLSIGDRLWSTMPHLRPMATVIGDSVQYGFDEDGAGVHDVIGTRCDPYVYERMTGKKKLIPTCHTLLKEAVKPFGLKESDVHDVFNIFMCTGYTKDTHEYFCKASPVRKGDFIDLIAEMDLLVALSACPQGDVSSPCGEEVPAPNCFPLNVEIFSPNPEILLQWDEMNANLLL